MAHREIEGSDAFEIVRRDPMLHPWAFAGRLVEITGQSVDDGIEDRDSRDADVFTGFLQIGPQRWIGEGVDHQTWLRPDLMEGAIEIGFVAHENGEVQVRIDIFKPGECCTQDSVDRFARGIGNEMEMMVRHSVDLAPLPMTMTPGAGNGKPKGVNYGDNGVCSDGQRSACC